MPTIARALLSLAGVVLLACAGSGVASASAAGSLRNGPAVVAISPTDGQTVGVAQPVTVEFVAPVPDRLVAQRKIAIESPAEMSGRFVWLSDRVVQWEPTAFWPAYTPVSVTAGDLSVEFDVGAAVTSVADISAHTFTVSIDGQVVREMPASLGKPGFDTPVGTFTVLEKQRRVKFDSRTIGIPLDDPEGYLIDGEYAVRITWGGVYVHSAPWSVGSQGYANVSHGCINLSPDNAAWYFDMVGIGDPVTVRG